MTRRLATLFAVVVMVVALSGPLVAQQESIEELRARAEAGDATAQYNLGVMYTDGEGLLQDDAEAMRWYRLAANNGSAEAMYSLGENYLHGKTVPVDIVQAHMWWNLAASRSTGQLSEGYAESRDSIGQLHLTRDQRAEAQRLAREWDEAHPRD
jgi:TPR repeat protein